MDEISLHVVDDSKSFIFAVKGAFSRCTLQYCDNPSETATFRILTYAEASEWLSHMQSSGEKPDVCLFDISMHGDDEAGLKLAHYVRKNSPQTIIIMFSQYDDSDTILKFMEAGADSFISKKTAFADLPREVYQAYRVALRKRRAETYHFEEFPVQRCAGLTLESVQRRMPGILKSAIRAMHVHGETGTGKEVVADLLEGALRDSGSQAPFVRINCGALSPSLLEGELFGHAKGAFTGATQEKIGLLESANGGWVYLDEVSALPLAAQSSLLRVLENQELLRLGETRPRKLRLRILSACNESLEEKVKLGTFRRDLWQRLLEAQITLPPLRERKSEIESIVRFLCQEMEGGPYVVTAATLELLKRHDWETGNVRELRNCLRAMTEFSETRILGPHSIPRYVFNAILLQNQLVEVGQLTAPKNKTVSFDFGLEPVKYEILEARLFANLVQHLASTISLSRSDKEVITLRDIEKATGLSRMTVSRKLKDAAIAGQLTRDMVPESFWRRNLSHISCRRKVGRPRKSEIPSQKNSDN